METVIREMDTVTEVCPHCEAENTIAWDTDKEGYTAYCPRCGKKMMLCDDCRHSPGFTACDWEEKVGC